MNNLHGKAERFGGDGPVTYTPRAATVEAAEIRDA